MNSFFKNAVVFLRRYSLIVLASVVVGNLIAWKNGDKKEDFFQYVIKARSRADYYDMVRSHFEKIAAHVSDPSKGIPAIKSIPVESYRNEDIYYVEMKLRFTDTSGAAVAINKVIALIKEDEEIKTKYFDRLQNLDLLIAEGKELVRFLESRSVAGEPLDAAARVQIFDTRFNLIWLWRDRDTFEQNISIYFPAPDTFTKVQTGNSPRTFLTASVLFLIIGLFLAVVVDRFRN